MYASPFFPRWLPSLLIAAALAAAASTASVAAPLVLAYTDDADPQSYTNLQAFHAHLGAVALGNAYALRANGSIDASGVTVNTGHVVAYAKSHALALYATLSDYNNTIQDWDPTISRTIEKNATNRAHAVANLVTLATANGYTGIDLDLEMVGQETNGPTVADTANHTAFVTALANALHAQGLTLIQSVPASDGTAAYAYYDGYNYAALGAVSDWMQIMTYDEVGPGWSSSPAGTWPGPDSGLDWTGRVMTYMTAAMPAGKILLGLPAYGYDFSTGQFQSWAADANYGTLGFTAYITSKKAATGTEASSYTPYATWGSVTPQSGAWSGAIAQPALWYDNMASITAKAALVPKYQLGGTGIWAMGYEDANFWSAHDAGLAGGHPANIAPLGTGRSWKGMASATANTGSVTNAAINDGNVAVSVLLEPNGEGGAPKWEAAGATWTAAHTVTSVTFTNGAIDANGNGYFQSGFGMQYTTDGTTWLQCNWTATPAYPYNAAAARKSYVFKGTTLGVLKGVRVVGRTGANSWSGSATEVLANGK